MFCKVHKISVLLKNTRFSKCFLSCIKDFYFLKNNYFFKTYNDRKSKSSRRKHNQRCKKFFQIGKTKKNKTIDTTIKGIPPGKYMPVEHLWNIPVRYSQHVGKIFPMKFWGIFQNSVPGILNIGIFSDCSMNILRMLLAFFWVDQEIRQQFSLVDKAVPDIRLVSLKI